MEEMTFFNVEFYRTLFSVLIGGLISIISIFLVEYLKNRKEKKERKKLLYNQIITTTNQIGRLASQIIDHRLAFDYHRRNFEISNETLSKEQADYNLKSCNNIINKMVEKLEQLDSYAIDYNVYFEKDNIFNNLLNKVLEWRRPELPSYNDLQSLKQVNEKFKNDFKFYKVKSDEFWFELSKNIKNHISKKLLD